VKRESSIHRNGQAHAPAKVASANHHQFLYGFHDKEIGEQGPHGWVLRCHHCRRRECAQQSHQRDKAALQKRKPYAEQCNKREPRKGNKRRQKIVKRIRRIDAGKRREQSRRGQRGRHMIGANGGDGALERSLAQPFASDGQHHAEQKTQAAACGRSQQSVIDRITHEERARECNGERADPNEPARRKRFFEAFGGGLIGSGRCRSADRDRFFHARRLFRFALRHAHNSRLRCGGRRDRLRCGRCGALAAQFLQFEAERTDASIQHGHQALRLVLPALLVARFHKRHDREHYRNEGKNSFHRIHHERSKENADWKTIRTDK
jgi:hypothetical protein